MSVISTNITSLLAQNSLSKSQNSLQTAMQRLSSGMRINSAKDDAAGQAIANRMSASITGMNQASRNANDGISLAQTMEGGLNQINDNLQRIRELAVQAASDTNSTADRSSIATEITQRVAEIDRIAGSTEFNGIKLLNTTGTLTIQVGAGTSSDDRLSIDKATVTSGDLSVKMDSASVASATAASSAIAAVDTAISSIDTKRSTLGATLNRFDSVISNLQTSQTNLSAARSRIQDADYSVEVANMTKSQILQQAGTSVLAQANQIPQSVLKLLG